MRAHPLTSAAGSTFFLGLFFGLYGRKRINFASDRGYNVDKPH